MKLEQTYFAPSGNLLFLLCIDFEKKYTTLQRQREWALKGAACSLGDRPLKGVWAHQTKSERVVSCMQARDDRFIAINNSNNNYQLKRRGVRDKIQTRCPDMLSSVLVP